MITGKDNGHCWRADLMAEVYQCGCIQFQDGIDRCGYHQTNHAYPWQEVEEFSTGQTPTFRGAPIVETTDPLPTPLVGISPAFGEVRLTDPTTGGQKGAKQEAYHLIPVGPLAEVARVYGFGASKYADRNWEKGYKWGLSYAALQRHVNAFWSREDRDKESGLSHLAHAVFHCLALMEWAKTHPELDDRPK